MSPTPERFVLRLVGFQGINCLEESQFLKDLLGKENRSAIIASVLQQRSKDHQEAFCPSVGNRKEKSEWIISRTYFKKACPDSTFLFPIGKVQECWNKAIMERLGENSEWLRGRKYLINPELLGPIRTAVHQARNNRAEAQLTLPDHIALPGAQRIIACGLMNVSRHSRIGFWGKGR